MSTQTSLVRTEEDRTVAILAYLTPVGFIAALVIHNDRKTVLGAFHLRQALGLLLASVALAICNVVPIIGQFVFVLGHIVLAVLWLLGLLAAVNGQMRPVPWIGPLVEEHMGTLFS